MTVGAMLREISSSELTEWMAYFKAQADPDSEKNINTAEVIKAMFAHRVKKSVK